MIVQFKYSDKPVTMVATYAPTYVVIVQYATVWLERTAGHTTPITMATWLILA